MWISSKEFAKLHGCNIEGLLKSIKRADILGKKFCTLKGKILPFKYINGIGRGGKVLQIWSEPFKSEAEADEFITNYRINRLENAVKARGIESNIASIKKELDTTMGGVVDSHNSLCSDLHICDDEVGVIKDILHTCNSGLDVTLSLNMTSGGSVDVSHTLNMTSKGSITSEYSTTKGSVNDEIAMSALQSRNDNVDYVKDVLNSRNDKEAQEATQDTKQETQDIHSQKAGQDNLTSFDFATTKARRIALEKKRIIKDWESLKNKGVSAKDFVAVVNLNANNDYNLKLSENKLYAWQRAYKEQGLDGLLDIRGYAREGINTISHLGLDSILDNILSAQSSRINTKSVHELLHLYLHAKGIHDIIDFKSKRSEYISYAVLNRYIKAWKKKNRLKVEIMHRGEDALIGNMKASLGKSNYKVTSINEVVEIDSTPLDKVFNAKSLAEGLGIDTSNIESWQKRYVLISLVDTYSRVVSFHISDTENSLGVARAVAKYILKYGKPKVIKGDNGKAFLSKYTKAVMENLDIEYKNVRAYSGWLKPYVENTFRSLQDRIISWGKGYIGHNVTQRQAIEFFFSKKERRLKKGALTNLKELDSFESMLYAIDTYTDTLLNNRYLDSLGMTPTEAYNQKANEAVAMNEYELIMKLSPSVKRRVNKKGIMHGGVWYQSIQAFNYDSVIVRPNINNTQELFIYDEKGVFVDIATRIGFDGVSAESAKMAEKISLKRIKAAKRDMQAAKDSQYANLQGLIESAASNAPRTIKPCVPKINNIDIVSAKLKSEANKAISGGDIVNLVELQTQEENMKSKGEVKRDLSFYSAVTKSKD